MHHKDQMALDAAIIATPAPKVFKEDIEAVIVGTTFAKLTGTLTVCVLTLRNGFTVTGESACASPENYSQEIGEDLAYKQAIGKVWALEAYLLREEMYALEVDDYNATYTDRVADYRSQSSASI